jgi:hypothetical protein
MIMYFYKFLINLLLLIYKLIIIRSILQDHHMGINIFDMILMSTIHGFKYENLRIFNQIYYLIWINNQYRYKILHTDWLE